MTDNLNNYAKIKSTNDAVAKVTNKICNYANVNDIYYIIQIQLETWSTF